MSINLSVHLFIYLYLFGARADGAVMSEFAVLCICNDLPNYIRTVKQTFAFFIQ